MKNERKVTSREAEIVWLSEVKFDPEVATAAESGYRRGFAPGINMAGDMMREGISVDEIDRLTDLSMDMRYDRQPHCLYSSDLRKLFDTGAHGKTGINLYIF